MDIFANIRTIVADGACVVGVGNPMRGDDAAGVLVAEALSAAAPEAMIVNAEDIIESYAFDVAGRNCDNVLLVDAVEAPHAPGSIIFGKFSEMKAASVNFSTHKLSLSLAADIMEMHGKTVYLLGIVPESTEFGAGVSPAVRRSADIVIELLTGCVNDYHKGACV